MRGRVSTSTLSINSSDCASIMWIMLVVSEVAAAIRPSGLTVTPSGSTPTSISSVILLFEMSMTEMRLSSSFATNKRLPSG